MAHGKRISNHELICPSSAIGIGLNDNADRKQLATLWAVDPVHLAPAGYAKLAEKMVEAAAELRKQHPPTDRKKNEIQMPPPTPYWATPYPRPAAKRLEGISRSDLAAPRWGDNRDKSGAAPNKRSRQDGQRGTDHGHLARRKRN